MSGLSHLKSSDLESLFPSESDPSTSPLQVLVLNNTGVGDEAAPFIGSCEGLEELGVASTKFTSMVAIQSLAVETDGRSADGIFAIIESCKKLQNLDVTSCRQIPIVGRRRIFEEGRWAPKTPLCTKFSTGMGRIQSVM